VLDVRAQRLERLQIDAVKSRLHRPGASHGRPDWNAGRKPRRARAAPMCRAFSPPYGTPGRNGVRPAGPSISKRVPDRRAISMSGVTTAPAA
jgi:hypothetical protein